jgi:transposase
MKVTTVGIDLAKNVFQIHGVDERGKPALRKRLRRSEMAEFFAALPPCLIGMEACGGAHFWARKLTELGHEVRLMAPQFVKPYVKGNKNDARDAEAICEAVERPNMRFVAIKTIDQQAVLALHRARQGLVKARTAQANQIRGLLAEFGIAIPLGIKTLPSRVKHAIDEAGDAFVPSMHRLFAQLLEHLRDLQQRVEELEQQIKAWHLCVIFEHGLHRLMTGSAG